MSVATMCAHCERAATAVRQTRAENELLRREIAEVRELEAKWRRQVHDLKLVNLRRDRSLSRRRVEKRTALELADHLEFSSGLEVRDLGHGRWAAQCPAHEDRSPSLGIKECADGTVLVNCLAGCPTEQVLASIGWEFSMLRAAA